MKDSILKRALLKVLMRIGRVKVVALAGNRLLLSRITDSYDCCNSQIIVEHGILPSIAVLNGFFQSEHTLIGVRSCDLSINPSILAEAKRWIGAQTLLPRCHHYFVHIRRSDYVSWPSVDAPAILSDSWYLAQMNKVVKYDAKAHFFIFSDDNAYVKRFLPKNSNIFVSGGSEERDLAAMSLCHGGGILSASSFSWWGSYYAKLNNNEAIFIAPRFWGGWRTNKWYPPKIKTSWIEYVNAF